MQLAVWFYWNIMLEAADSNRGLAQKRAKS